MKDECVDCGEGFDTAPRPLALTDDQLSVFDHAKMVPSRWRSRFLQNVADRLLPLETITKDDVQEAIVPANLAAGIMSWNEVIPYMGAAGFSISNPALTPFSAWAH